MLQKSLTTTNSVQAKEPVGGNRCSAWQGYNKGESIDCKLRSLGLSTSDIDYLFLSHMDFDHTSGLCLVQNVKRIMVQKKNLQTAKNTFSVMSKQIGILRKNLWIGYVNAHRMKTASWWQQITIQPSENR